MKLAGELDSVLSVCMHGFCPFLNQRFLDAIFFTFSLGLAPYSGSQSFHIIIFYNITMIVILYTS